MPVQRFAQVFGAVYVLVGLLGFAFTGFANFASVGILLGGIGAIAPGRRADLAKLGMRALFVGFLATLINAAVAGMLMPSKS